MTGSSIVLFGAGDAGRRALAALDPSIRVIAIADNDATKHGGFFLGHEIVAPARIPALAPDCVVVASMYWKEIVAQLAEIGLGGDRVVVDPVSRGGAAAMAQPNVQASAMALPDWMCPDLRLAEKTSKNREPLVSVVLPTRDRASVLPRAIDSVLAQRHRNLELLVVDDGSTDKTVRILRRYAATDKRVRIVRQSKRGVCAARNRGLAAARGKLVAYIDSDNRWHPDYLVLMVCGFRDAIRRTGYAGFNVFDLRTGYFHAIVAAFDYERLQQRNWIDLNAFMHRRDLVAQLGGFDEGMTRLVDWELILRYTRLNPPFVIGCALVDYFHEPKLARITETEPFRKNHAKLRQMLANSPRRQPRRRGPLRLAVVQHEFPVVSQTFVQNEIARLREAGLLVSMFYFREAFAKAEVPQDWDLAKFSSREELTWLLASRQIDLVHTHFAMPHPADVIVPVCERLDLPFTIKPHAFDIFRNDHDPRHHISLTAGHRLCRAVFCEGEFHRQFLRKAGVPEEKLLVVRNVCDLERFRARSRRQRPKVSRLVAVSRFVEKKGFHLLISAFRKLSDSNLRLELHGYGEEQERLMALAVGDDRISFHEGPRSPGETALRLKDADFFVLPCITDRYGDSDGLPTVLMEAMAARVPVLTAPVASTPDLVVNGKTGLLVESGSIPALVRGLRQATGMSGAERSKLARSARQHLWGEFDPDLNILRLIDAWRGIVPEAFADAHD